MSPSAQHPIPSPNATAKAEGETWPDSPEKVTHATPPAPSLPAGRHGRLGERRADVSSPDLEEAVLGACMLERDTFEQVLELIPYPHCFYVPIHQHIYQAMCRLHHSGAMVDLLTITDALGKAGKLQEVGGAYHLTRLTMSVLSTAHVRAHAAIVMEKHMLREGIRTCMQFVADANDPANDVFELLDKLEAATKAITGHISARDDISAGDSYRHVLDDYDTQKRNQSPLIGVTTGYDDLDRITGGWRSPSLIIIGAKPSQGKTALMLNLLYNAAVKGHRSKIYSLETGATALTRRLAAAHSSLPFEHISRGTLSDHREVTLHNAVHRFYQLPISITCKVFYIEDLEKSVRREKKKHPALSLIAIDFIQLIRMRTPGRLNKFEVVGEVSRRLKLLSAELDLPIIALSQLNRAVNQNSDRRPEAHNLANTSELEQNADIIIFIHYQPPAGDPAANPEPILIVAQNKDGRCGDIPIRFDPGIQKWLNREDPNQHTHTSYMAAAGLPNSNKQQEPTDWDG